MSGAKKNTPKGFSGFDKMSTKELEEFLYMDSKMPAGATDVDAILYISKLLAGREWQSQKERDAMVRKAWESFNKNYRPEPGEHVPLYEETDEPDDVSHIQLIVPENKRKRILSRIACIAIICVGLFTIGTATAYAFGFDGFHVVAEWSSEQFHFSSGEGTMVSGKVVMNPELEELHAILTKKGINEKLAPKTLADGFVQDDIAFYDLADSHVILASYTNGEKFIGIHIAQRDSGVVDVAAQYEKSGELPAPYTIAGIDHYLFVNNGQNTAAWVNNQFECSIWGDISQDEILLMIQSIYEE